MNNFATEKVVINNPIGNLYRKSHVLILVVNKEGNFVLGKKKDFYPNRIARMLGGGINEDEDSIHSAKREIQEELMISISLASFKPLGVVITKDVTKEGDMEMQTWIYSVGIPDSSKIKPSDDISGIQIFTPERYILLVEEMTNLSGEFITDKFSFFWSDWGKIYAPIHKHAPEWYKDSE